MPASTFIASIPKVSSFGDAGWLGPSHKGTLPFPFGARDGGELAARDGEHPLPRLTADDLIERSSVGLSGGIEVSPARVGEGISGRVIVSARKPLTARSTSFCLVGLVATEEDEQSGDSHSRLEWVEVRGRIFERLEFSDVRLPAELGPDGVVIPFLIPAPRLGPPSFHAGIALVAWAVEARWDIERGFDEHLAAVVPVAQHPDLLRAGVQPLGEGAMFDVCANGGATFAVSPVPPYAPGDELDLAVSWPDAPAGRAVRIEHVVSVGAANRVEVSPTVLTIERAMLAGVQVRIAIPPDAPSSIEAEGVTVVHLLRAVVDRPLRPDVIAERRIAVL
jgi:hypothetical protein